jgi:hypothetical protein
LSFCKQRPEHAKKDEESTDEDERFFSFHAGFAKVRSGARVYEIGEAIQKQVATEGFFRCTRVIRAWDRPHNP